MPTILRVGPYRFFFYAGDGEEPAHVHVERDANEAKFWLEPIRLERSRGFRPADVRDIQQIVETNLQLLLEKWHEFFDN